MAESDNMPTKRPFGMTLITISVALTASLTFLNGLDWLGLASFIIFGSGLPVFGLPVSIVGLILLLWGTYGILRAERLWHMEQSVWKWTVLWLLFDLGFAFLASSYVIAILGMITLLYLYTKRNIF